MTRIQTLVFSTFILLNIVLLMGLGVLLTSAVDQNQPASLKTTVSIQTGTKLKSIQCYKEVFNPTIKETKHDLLTFSTVILVDQTDTTFVWGTQTDDGYFIGMTSTKNCYNIVVD